MMRTQAQANYDSIRLEKHMPQIKAIAFRFYKVVPPAAKGSVDIDDMIGIGIVVFHRCVIRWDRHRTAKFNTYLHTALTNKFKDLLVRVYRQNRLELSEQTIQQLEGGAREDEPKIGRKQTQALIAACNSDMSIGYRFTRRLEAELAMQRLLRVASPDEIALVRSLIFPAVDLPPQPEVVFASLLPRLREIFQRFGLTYEDLRVLRHAGLTA